MTERLDSRIKYLIEQIISDCESERDNFQKYRNQLDGVYRFCQLAKYNGKTLRAIKDAKSACFEIGHGMNTK